MTGCLESIRNWSPAPPAFPPHKAASHQLLRIWGKSSIAYLFIHPNLPGSRLSAYDADGGGRGKLGIQFRPAQGLLYAVHCRASLGISDRARFAVGFGRRVPRMFCSAGSGVGRKQPHLFRRIMPAHRLVLKISATGSVPSSAGICQTKSNPVNDLWHCTIRQSLNPQYSTLPSAEMR